MKKNDVIVELLSRCRDTNEKMLVLCAYQIGMLKEEENNEKKRLDNICVWRGHYTGKYIIDDDCHK
jgi:hypothetical protein